MSKINYCSRANQWCNWHVNLQVFAFRFYRTSKIKGYVKKTNFGHFDLNFSSLSCKNRSKNPWDYKTRAQKLTSGAILMFIVICIRWDLRAFQRCKGMQYEGQNAASISVAYWTFFTNFNTSWHWMDQSALNWWPN